MAGIEEYRDGDGNIRMLSRLEPNDTHKKMRAGMPSITQYLQSNGGDLIPLDKIQDISRRESLGTQFINNQQSSSGCTCWDGAQQVMRRRAMQGMQFQDLSGAWAYANINGGRDAGSVMTDFASLVQRVGIPLRSTMDLPHIFSNQIPAGATQEAGRFKANVVCTLGSWQEILTAITLFGCAAAPICVGGNFEPRNGDGIAGYTPGGGNHAVGFDGIKTINGKRYLDMFNSWGPTWNGNGRCYVSQQAIESAGYPEDGYAIVDMCFDPQDPNLPPAPVN